MNDSPTTYVVWFGSVAPRDEVAWYVLDKAREERWGYLAAPAAGPFATKNAALADANLLAAAAPGNRVES